MEPERSNRDTPPIYLVIAFLLIYIMAARTPIDSDLWWHLRAGEETLRTGQPVVEDAFSFTRSGEQWTNHSWLTQVLLAGIFDLAGFTGLSILMGLCAVLSLWLVSKQMTGGPILRMVLLIFGGVAASVNWVPRPQMISLVMLALTGALLARYLRKPDRWIWLFPSLMMWWGNLHGGYALGLLLAGGVIGGSALEHVFGATTRLTWKDIVRLTAATGLGYLATAVGPNGVNTLWIPFQTVGVESLQNLISEWASPDFHDPLTRVFLVYFLMLVWILTVSKRRASLADLTSLTIFGFLAFTARRNIGPFILVSLPVFSARLAQLQLPETWRAWLEKARRNWAGQSGFSELSRRSTNTMILFLLAIAAIVKTSVVTQPDFVQAAIRQYYPLTAIEWMQSHLPPVRVVNEYNWGGFLLWQWPESEVFIDGRTDLYGDTVMGEWMEIMQCGEETAQILDRWDAEALLVEPGRPVSTCLLQNGWENVYQDEQAVILVRDAGLLR